MISTQQKKVQKEKYTFVSLPLNSDHCDKSQRKSNEWILSKAGSGGTHAHMHGTDVS